MHLNSTGRNNNNNNNNNNNKGLRGWDEVVVCTHPRGIDANIQPLYAQDRPFVMKGHILQEVALFNILAEHGGSRGVNLEKNPPV
jgi:hypothetical protein